MAWFAIYCDECGYEAWGGSVYLTAHHHDMVYHDGKRLCRDCWPDCGCQRCERVARRRAPIVKF